MPPCHIHSLDGTKHHPFVTPSLKYNVFFEIAKHAKHCQQSAASLSGLRILFIALQVDQNSLAHLSTI